MGINLKEIGESSQTTEYSPLPEGRYNVKITAAEIGKTKTSNNDMITVTYEVIEGKYTNRKLWSNFTLTPKAYVYLYSLLKAIKSDLIEEEDVEPEEIAKALVGGKCSILAQVETSNGTKTKNVVSNFKSLDEAGDLAKTTSKTLFE